MIKAYEHFFFHYTSSDLLIVNTSDIDFVYRNEDLQELLRKVTEPIKGTQYFLPLGGEDGARFRGVRMGYIEEFSTVELILNSGAETRAVDAFVLSRVKAERQVRRLVTHLIYQFQCFGPSDKKSLRGTLAKSKSVYFEGFERGFNAIYNRSIRDLVGSEYVRLHSRVLEAFPRNKIFHGQLTHQGLPREEILGYVTDISSWCKALACGCMAELHYDGFGRNSFQKSKIPNISSRFKIQMAGLPDYEKLIREHLENHKGRR